MDQEYESVLESIMKEALLQHNIRFKEQVYVHTKISNYFMDFIVYGEYCKLVVECDGIFHCNHSRRAMDAIRDLWCVQNGFQEVFRFSGDQVLNHISECIENIKHAIHIYDAILKKNGMAPNLEHQISEYKNTDSIYQKSEYVGLRVNIGRNNGHIEREPLFSQVCDSNWNHIKNKLSRNDKVIKDKLKIDEQHLPENEKPTLQIIKQLSPCDKKLLWKLIKIVNIDGISIYHGSHHDVEKLCQMNLLTVIQSQSSKIGLIVLPKAPYLLHQLRRISRQQD